MKKLVLAVGFLGLLTAVALQAYFKLVPPPAPTLERALKDVAPASLPGWDIEDHDLAETPESAARIEDRLLLDDALFRVYRKGDTFVVLYIAYWTPGKVPYRYAGAHTPDTCWVQAGWTCTDRAYKVPFEIGGQAYDPAEFGIYERDGSVQKVYFWHLIGGEAYGYEQQDMHNIFGALQDIREYGLNLRQEQFFIRLSSNKNLEALKAIDGFEAIAGCLAELGLEIDA